MNIFFAGNFPPPIHGVAIINSLLYNGLKKRGLRIYRLITNTSNDFQDFSYQGSLSFRKFIITSYQSIKGTLILCIKQPNVIYLVPGESFFGFLRFIPFILIGKAFKKKVILHFHGEVFLKNYISYSSFKKSIIAYSLRNATKLIVLGQTYVEKFSKTFDNCESKLTICMNGISNEYLANDLIVKRKVNEIKDGHELKILFLSNLMESKGVLDLFDSIEYLNQSGLNYRIDLCGAIEPEISELVNEKILKYSKYVTYHGTVNGLVKKKILENSHVLCLPTYMPSEAQPVSIMEAMANGIAVVVTDVGGIRDIFDQNENGFFCYVKEPSSIAESIIKCYNKYESIAQNNYLKAIDKFEETKFIQRVNTIIIES